MGTEGTRPLDPGGPRVSPARATAALVAVCLFWGLSFPLLKNWQTGAYACPGGPLLAALTLCALRMGLGSALLAAWQPRLFACPERRAYLYGGIIALVFFLGAVLQVVGLTWTTPALSAFFTSLGSAWVPLIAWAVLGLAVARLTLVGLGIALAGTAVLVEGGWRLGPGEALTLFTSVVFAAQILLLDRLGQKVRTDHLSAGFLLGNTALGLAGVGLAAVLGPGLGPWARWAWGMLTTPAIALDLALLVVFPTVLGFHWMNTYQPFVPASRAALLYLLEPVFGSFFSVLWGHDPLTLVLVAGGGLILAGNVLVELPGWLRGADAKPQAAKPAGDLTP
jgi:drug/metabolite transporter (DMT)-like permease